MQQPGLYDSASGGPSKETTSVENARKMLAVCLPLQKLVQKQIITEKLLMSIVYDKVSVTNILMLSSFFPVVLTLQYH